jgi:hypothetical protein
MKIMRDVVFCGKLGGCKKGKSVASIEKFFNVKKKMKKKSEI